MTVHMMRTELSDQGEGCHEADTQSSNCATDVGQKGNCLINGALVNDAALAAINAHDDFKEHIFTCALRAMDHDGGLHLGTGVLYGVGQPAQHPLE